jgi:hypothetical protein
MKPRHKIPTPKEAGIDTSSFFKKLKNSFSGNHQHSGHSHDNHSHNHDSPVKLENGSVHTIAIVLDDQVYDILRAQDSLAEILLAQPTFVLVTNETSVAKIKSKYVDGKFVDNEQST